MKISTNTKKYYVAILIISIIFMGGCADNVDDKDIRNREPLSDVDYWAYQIQDQTEDDNIDKLAESHYDLLVIDQTRSIKGEETYDSLKDVSFLKGSTGSRNGKKLVVCYIDVGEAESYRWYWKDEWRIGKPDWIVAEDPDGWDENYPVKFWRDEWKDIMKEYLDRIIEDGYDGIYLDWLEVYSFKSVSDAAEDEGLDPREELIGFISELSEYARSKRKDFIIIAQNAAEMGQSEEYVELFDAIAQEAIWFDGSGDPDISEQTGDKPIDSELTEEYLDYLEEWQKLDKPVLNVEYAADAANAEKAYKLGEEHKFITYTSLRPLAELTKNPPPGY